MTPRARSAARAAGLVLLGLVLLPAVSLLPPLSLLPSVPERAACGAAERLERPSPRASGEAHAALVWPLPLGGVLSRLPGPACGQEPTDDPPTAEGPGLERPTAERDATEGLQGTPDTDVRRITLEEAIRTALLRNPDLSMAEADLDEAEADRLSAWGSFLPDVSAGYGYSKSSTGRLDPTGQQITNTSWFSELRAGYDVFSGLRRVTDLRGTRRRVSAADARLEERRFETILRVKTSFYSAIAARQLVEVERDRVRRQEAQLDSVSVQLELGRVARTDVLRSEVALNNARLALIRAESAARTATFRLAREVGLREPATPADEADLEPRPLELTREEAVTVGLRAGPSVSSARADAEAASAEAWSARSRYLPDLRVEGVWAWQAPEFPPADRSWQVFVFGRYPLFNGFQRESEVARRSARADAARAEERAAELELRAAVDSAYSMIEAALASISLAEQTVELAGEELAAQQERFRLGRGTILEVQEAQIALQQAEVDRVRARLDYQVGVAQLEYLLGEELSWGPADGSEGRSACAAC